MPSPKDVRKALREAAVDTGERLELPCAAAFRIADRLDCKLAEIARLCDAEDIRVVRCQLGCF